MAGYGGLYLSCQWRSLKREKIKRKKKKKEMDEVGKDKVV